MLWRRPPPPAELVAIDLETSTLARRDGALLAVGLIPLREGSILWGERFYALVRDDRLERPRDLGALGAHQILPSETRQGVALSTALARVEAMLGERGVLLGHGVAIERRALRSAARALGKSPPRLVAVDTLAYLRRVDAVRTHLAGRLPPSPRGDGSVPFALAAARDWLGLPAYPAHHALYDALAAAELYLLLARRFPELYPRIRA